MNTRGNCRLCGQPSILFCCQKCYERDATKSTKKQELTGRITALEAELEAIQANSHGIHESWRELHAETKDLQTESREHRRSHDPNAITTVDWIAWTLFMLLWIVPLYYILKGM